MEEFTNLKKFFRLILELNVKKIHKMHIAQDILIMNSNTVVNAE